MGIVNENRSLMLQVTYEASSVSDATTNAPNDSIFEITGDVKKYGYKDTSGNMLYMFSSTADVSGKANLAGGNAFTGTQSLNNSAATPGFWRLRNTEQTMPNFTGPLGSTFFDVNTVGIGSQYSATDGGLSITGISKNLASFGLVLGGYMPAGTVTGAAFVLLGRKHNGTTGAVDMGAAETVLQVNNNTTPILTLKGNGDFSVAGRMLLGTNMANTVLPNSTVIQLNSNSVSGLLVLNTSTGTGSSSRIDVATNAALTGPRIIVQAIPTSSSGLGAAAGTAQISANNATEMQIAVSNEGGNSTAPLKIVMNGNTLATFKTNLSMDFANATATPGTPAAGFTMYGSTNAVNFKLASGGVVSLQQVAGWALPTGNVSRATFNPATVSPTQTAETLAALIVDFYNTIALLKA